MSNPSISQDDDEFIKPFSRFIDLEYSGPSHFCSTCIFCRGEKPRARDILNTPVNDIISGIENSKKSTSLFNEPMSRFYIPIWFQSHGVTCLYRCLLGTYNWLAFVLAVRLGHTPTETQELFKEHMTAGVDQPPASLFIARNSISESIESMLEAAIRFWAEAAWLYDHAIENNADEARVWPHLNQATMYLGMASGPDFPFEVGKDGANKRYKSQRQKELPVKKCVMSILQSKKTKSKKTFKALLEDLTSEPNLLKVMITANLVSHEDILDKQMIDMEKNLRRIIRSDGGDLDSEARRVWKANHDPHQ